MISAVRYESLLLIIYLLGTKWELGSQRLIIITTELIINLAQKRMIL